MDNLDVTFAIASQSRVKLAVEFVLATQNGERLCLSSSQALCISRLYGRLIRLHASVYYAWKTHKADANSSQSNNASAAYFPYIS